MYASLIPVADPGEGPSPPPPHIFGPNRGPKGPKKFVEGGGTASPPYLRVWMTSLPPLSSTAYTCITCIVNQLHPVSQDSSLMWFFLLL